MDQRKLGPRCATKCKHRCIGHSLDRSRRRSPFHDRQDFSLLRPGSISGRPRRHLRPKRKVTVGMRDRVSCSLPTVQRPGDPCGKELARWISGPSRDRLIGPPRLRTTRPGRKEPTTLRALYHSIAGGNGVLPRPPFAVGRTVGSGRARRSRHVHPIMARAADADVGLMPVAPEIW